MLNILVPAWHYFIRTPCMYLSQYDTNIQKECNVLHIPAAIQQCTYVHHPDSAASAFVVQSQWMVARITLSRRLHHHIHVCEKHQSSNCIFIFFYFDVLLYYIWVYNSQKHTHHNTRGIYSSMLNKDTNKLHAVDT